MALILPISVLCLSLLLLYWLKRALNPRSRLPLPPIPQDLPIIGNLLDIPKVMPWKAFSEWSKLYSELLSLFITRL